jgi:nucleotide-binding universal stress UspA family protein
LERDDSFNRRPLKAVVSKDRGASMSYNDIAVQIDAAAPAARYQIAAELAARGGGRLTGLYLKTTLINQFNDISALGYMPPGELDRLIRDHDQGQDEDAAEAGAALSKIARQAKADCVWRVIGGDTPADLIAEARLADLMVMGSPSASPAYNVHASPVEVALGGGPVLIVPAEVQKTKLGARALIGWNGGREAARALRDALPLLAEGAAIEVRIAHPKDEKHDDAGLRRHLEQHGFKVNIATVVDEGQSIAHWLAEEAVSTGCDLIVTGLYGHPRLRELVLGGVSREMPRLSPLPLLISH